MRDCREDLHLLLNRTPSMLQTWALMKLGRQSRGTTAIAVRSLDLKTLWVAHQLEVTLGWKPRIHRSLVGVAEWLTWAVADGSEPLLDCSGAVSLVAQSAAVDVQ
jgi:hypothetical protein